MDFTVFINAGPWLAVPPPGYGGVENMLRRRRQAHAWLVDQFVDWLDGDPPMATNVEDNSARWC
jgi:hypothetical protein